MKKGRGESLTPDRHRGVHRMDTSKIDLTPEDGRLAITLHGDLASMLSFAASTKKPGIPGGEAGLSVAIGSQASLVAGVGFEPTTFRL